MGWIYHEAKEGKASGPLSCTGPSKTLRGACPCFHMGIYSCQISRRYFRIFKIGPPHN